MIRLLAEYGTTAKDLDGSMILLKLRNQNDKIKIYIIYFY